MGSDGVVLGLTAIMAFLIGRLEPLIVLLLNILVFWDVMLCRLTNIYRRFESLRPFETSVTVTSRHGITHQKILNFKTLDPIDPAHFFKSKIIDF